MFKWFGDDPFTNKSWLLHMKRWCCRDLVGDVELMAADGAGLTGTSATIDITEVGVSSQ